MEITEFILTAQAVIKALTKIVGIEPPTLTQIKDYVQGGLVNKNYNIYDNYNNILYIILKTESKNSIINWFIN